MMRRKLVTTIVSLTVGAVTTAFCQRTHAQQEDPNDAYIQAVAAELGNPPIIYPTPDDETWPVTGSDPIPPVKPGR